MLSRYFRHVCCKISCADWLEREEEEAEEEDLGEVVAGVVVVREVWGVEVPEEGADWGLRLGGIVV